MQNAKAWAVLMFVFLFAVSFASANTFILGKVYQNNLATPISGATVTTTCAGNGLTTTSLSDGTYGIGYTEINCPDGSSVSISASYSNFGGSTSATIDNANATDYFTITNIKLTENPVTYSGGGGGSSGGRSLYYNCGNGICDSGESSSLCPSDCPLPVVNQEVPVQETQVLDQTEQTPTTAPSTFLGLTGAFLGANATPIIAALIFIVVLGVITILIIRKRRKSKKNASK